MADVGWRDDPQGRGVFDEVGDGEGDDVGGIMGGNQGTLAGRSRGVKQRCRRVTTFVAVRNLTSRASTA